MLKSNAASIQLCIFIHYILLLQVFQRAGFLRSDKSCGHCELKLSKLESECELHESVDLLEGRRACGGKLEVRSICKNMYLINYVHV